MAVYKTEGIVLRTRNLGEADRIVTIYTSRNGKVDAVARGSRKAKSRMAGAIQLFTLGHYMIYPGRSLDRLTGADIIDSMVGVRDDLIKLAHGSYVAELADVMTMPGEPGEELFRLLLDTLTALHALHEPALVIRRFEIGLMHLLGYAPHLNSCVHCGSADGVDSSPRLSAKEGGLLCPACGSQDGSAIKVTRATIKWMIRLPETPAERLGIFRLSDDEHKLLARVLRAYVDYRLPRPLKSVSFLDSLTNFA